MREEEKKRTSQDSSFKRFMKKRWVFPAIYIASAALILTAVFWYQTSSINNATKDNKYDYNATDLVGKNKPPVPAMEVNTALENIKWPLANHEQATVQKPFYDVNGSDEQQQAALVSYNNSYQPNTGIDVTMSGDSFEVKAALSGTVTKVETNDTLLGNVVEIMHDNNVVTHYSSITDIKVKEGDEVKQGQALAMAGQSLLNEEAGVHVHFEIRKDTTPVNPIEFFEKPASSVVVEKAVQEEAVENDGNVEKQTTEEESKTIDSNKNAEGTGTSDGKSDKIKDDSNATNP
ncbi:peptidoglycan DD-metalloendopeptidase family protein [Pseudoneobacillus sp. C159]